MKVLFLFRVDINEKIGAGHLMRCCALAAAAERQKYDVLFMADEYSEKYLRQLSAFVYSTKILKPCMGTDAEWIEIDQIEILAKNYEGLPILVLDGYQFNQEYRKTLKQRAEKIGMFIITLDDENNQGSLFADVIVNSLSEAQSLGYEKTNPKSLLLLGEEYVLRQEAYLRSRDLPYSKAKSLTLSFGASDPKGLTIHILNYLMNDPDYININVVTGAAFPNVFELSKMTSLWPNKVKHFHNLPNLRDVMMESRLFVSAAGGTSFELEALAVPSILVCVANNQFNAAIQHEKNAWCKFFDASDFNLDAVGTGQNDRVIQDLIKLIKKCWNDDRMLNQWHEVGSLIEVSDGAGAVIDSVLNFLKSRELNNYEYTRH